MNDLGRLWDAWRWTHALAHADVGEWQQPIAQLEAVGYRGAVMACCRAALAVQQRVKLRGDGLPGIDVTFIDGEPWRLELDFDPDPFDVPDEAAGRVAA